MKQTVKILDKNGNDIFTLTCRDNTILNTINEAKRLNLDLTEAYSIKFQERIY